jgi:S1-C subfamily serine protease
MSKLDKNEIILWLVSACAAVLLVVTLLLLQNIDFNKLRSQPDIQPQAIQNTTAQAKVVAHQDNMSGAAVLVMPSIVCVCTTGTDSVQEGFHLEGIGSGIIVQQEGFVLTSAHAASGNTDLKVTLYERSHFEGQAFEIGHNHIYDAEVVTVSPALQLAVLKINGRSLPVARFAKSNELRRGDWCLAVWNELGRKPSVSAGIITALDQTRNIRGIKTKHLVEMSCKGSKNFEGGTLINKWGELTGIIVNKGIAVPGKQARALLQSLGIILN